MHNPDLIQFERGDFVLYRSACSTPVEGIIRSVHRDGTYTVEARHTLDRNGRRTPGYLGYRYLIEGADLLPRDAVASDGGDVASIDVSRLTSQHRKLVAHLARVLEPQGAAQ